MKWDWQVRVKSVTNFLSHQQSLRNIWLFTPDMSAVFAKRLTEKKLTWANISNSNTRMHYHCQISLVSYAEDRAPLNRTWILTWSLFIQRKILKDIDVTSAKRDSWESVIWMCIWHSLIWLEKRNWKPMVLLSASIVLGHTKWRKSWRLMKGCILKNHLNANSVTTAVIERSMWTVMNELIQEKSHLHAIYVSKSSITKVPLEFIFFLIQERNRSPALFAIRSFANARI